MTVISFVLNFVETPRIKFGSSENAHKKARMMPPVGLSVVFNNKPASASERVLTADSATAKVGHPTANASQPETISTGTVGQSSLSASVALIENHLTFDSVTATVDRQSALNILASQPSSMPTPISLTEFNEALPDWVKAKEIPTLTASISLTESDKALPDLLKAKEIPTLSSSKLTEASESLAGFLECQQKAPTLTAISLTEDRQATSGILGVQQLPNFDLPTGSSRNCGIPQTLNPTVQ